MKKEKIPTPEEMLFNLEVVFHNLEGMDYAGDVAYLFEGILKNLIKLQNKTKKRKVKMGPGNTPLKVFNNINNGKISKVLKRKK